MKYLKIIYNNIKYLKTFEENDSEPQVGDYVLCEEHIYPENTLTNFLNTHIGIITADDYIKTKYRYDVDFKVLIPPDNLIDSRRFMLDEIVHWSKNKEDLEVIMSANKYNL
jgi:hypothetical protein